MVLGLVKVGQNCLKRYQHGNSSTVPNYLRGVEPKYLIYQISRHNLCKIQGDNLKIAVHLMITKHMSETTSIVYYHVNRHNWTTVTPVLFKQDPS